MTDLDPGACDCFAHRLTGLGFDDEQQVLVWQLMAQAHMAGATWLAVDLFGERARDVAWNIRLGPRALDIKPEMINICLQQVMENRAEPMSAEVAAAVRGHR
jgi:hypothetical protein